MRRLRVLVLMHPDLVPPASAKGYSALEINKWKTEYDVVSTLRAAGHEVMPLGVQYELKPIRDAIEEFKADVAFNLLEQFHGETAYDTNVASYLELLSEAEVEAALAHELGHVWIYTHHPYLQTEQLANRIAMRTISRESLASVYQKVWQRLGEKGDLSAFLGLEQ